MQLNWDALINACITGSVVGAVTGITSWLLNRHFLRRLEQIEDSIKKRKEKERRARRRKKTNAK